MLDAVVAVLMEDADMYENECRTLFAELSELETRGIVMKLGNQIASPMQIVTALMVKEDNSYMRDYIWDEDGHMKELTFHHIMNQ